MLSVGEWHLPEACFRRYLVQDYLFLIHFARAWGLAIYKSELIGGDAASTALVAATLDVEIGLHIEYCRGWGLSEAAMASEREAPATIAYTRFVLDRGLAGDRLDLEVALAPCIVGYAVIAAERMEDPATRLDGNRYREWLEMYAGSDYQSLARKPTAALDELFDRRGGEGRFASLATTFATAARLEADFWQMGLEASAVNLQASRSTGQPGRPPDRRRDVGRGRLVGDRSACWSSRASRSSALPCSSTTMARADRTQGACCAGRDIYDAHCVAAASRHRRIMSSITRAASALQSSMILSTPTAAARRRSRVSAAISGLSFAIFAGGARSRRLGVGDRALCPPDRWRRTGPELHRAREAARDQSYFLFARRAKSSISCGFRWAASQGGDPRPGSALRPTRSPTSRTARTSALSRPDHMPGIVERLRPEACAPGDIVGPQRSPARPARRHRPFYSRATQRARVAAGEPLYVVRIDPEERRVVVGPPRSPRSNPAFARRGRIGSPRRPSTASPVAAKLRSTQPPVPATFYPGRRRRSRTGPRSVRRAR